MRILAIETSCDETAVALVEGHKEKSGWAFKILGNSMFSQIKIHEKYGGVFPMVAKREHAKALTTILKEVLENSRETKNKINSKKIRKILEREEGLANELIPFLEKVEKPKIDCLAVTVGPGLEPALWVGINFAKALSIAWNIPIIPINHMEGHILSALLQKRGERNSQFKISNLKFPILALLISGGHTELVLAKKIGEYKIIGETRDDAVGEAYDKVARMLGLPYPGGPQISKLAEEARQLSSLATQLGIKLPRPMINSKDFDFSFAGLKTAVLYTLKKIPNVSTGVKKEMALEFENAATDVLIAKTKKALIKTKANMLVVGGGVSANIHIRREFEKLVKEQFPSVKLLIPEQKFSTDNAIMIGLAAFFKNKKRESGTRAMIRADGNLRL